MPLPNSTGTNPRHIEPRPEPLRGVACPTCTVFFAQNGQCHTPGIAAWVRIGICGALRSCRPHDYQASATVENLRLISMITLLRVAKSRSFFPQRNVGPSTLIRFLAGFHAGALEGSRQEKDKVCQSNNTSATGAGTHIAMDVLPRRRAKAASRTISDVYLSLPTS